MPTPGGHDGPVHRALTRIGPELCGVDRAVVCPPVPPEMHRKGEGAIALGARESASALTQALTHLRLRVDES